MTRDSIIAWLAAAAHVAAAVAMLLLLRAGLPPASDAERIAYIAMHRAAWTAGWLTWQFAVITLIALYAVLAQRLGGPLPLAGLVMGTAGAAIDIATQIRYILVMPQLQGDAFALLDRELEVLTGFRANGLYTLGFVLIAVGGWRVLPPLANVLVAPVAVSGFALAIAALMHHAPAEIISSGILFPLFTLWVILIARWLRNA